MSIISNSNTMAEAQSIIDSFVTIDGKKVKRVKNDKGLIEKVNADENKVILAEDNRQIICG